MGTRMICWWSTRTNEVLVAMSAETARKLADDLTTLDARNLILSPPTKQLFPLLNLAIREWQAAQRQEAEQRAARREAGGGEPQTQG